MSTPTSLPPCSTVEPSTETRNPRAPIASRKDGAGAAGVGEEGLPDRREQSQDQVREGRGVPSLVEHIGGEDEVEGPETIELRREPVEEHGRRLPAQVGAGVVGYEVEGGTVVVGCEDFRAAVQRHYCGEPDTAPELDGAFAAQVLVREIARKGDRARPELGPVRESLLVLEVFLVEQVVDGGGMR